MMPPVEAQVGGMGEGHMPERPRVMIVERDWDFGIKLADWLAAHGYQPVLVRTVEAAMSELRDIRPHAIFVGLGAPDRSAAMSPSEALLMIRTICPCVPVIPIANEGAEEMTHVIMRQGVRRFLVKPVEFSQLGAVLHAELSGGGGVASAPAAAARRASSPSPGASGLTRTS